MRFEEEIKDVGKRGAEPSFEFDKISAAGMTEASLS